MSAAPLVPPLPVGSFIINFQGREEDEEERVRSEETSSVIVKVWKCLELKCWLLVKTWTLQTLKSASDCLSWRVELPSSFHLVFATSIRWPGLHPEWVSIISLGGGVKFQVKQPSGPPEDSFRSFLEVYPTLPNHGQMFILPFQGWPRSPFPNFLSDVSDS